MAVVLRLKRIGRRNRPAYRICVFDSRTRRDGPPIEEIGHYDPLVGGEVPQFQLDEERARHWLGRGATMSETVASLLRRRGISLWTGRGPRRRRRARRRGPQSAARKGTAKA